MDFIPTWLKGFAIFDAGGFVCLFFIYRLLGKPMPGEALFRRVVEWARAHRWI